MASPRKGGGTQSGDALASSSPSRRGPNLDIAWRFAPFAELTPHELHDMFQLRAAVFVVEQKCPFQDVDGVDPECWHLLGWRADELVVYCRLVPPGVKYAEPSIGRVVSSAAARRTGSGKELMREALARAAKLWPGMPIRIGAQRYLERFYGGYGFVTASAPYDEDGIMHVEMVKN